MALGAALPGTSAPTADALATLLTDLATGRITAEEAQAQLSAIPDLLPLAQGLAGRELQLGQALIAFGAGSQLGDVSVGDIAGRDLTKISLVVQQTTMAPEQAYDVRGLANPYLGLRAFTYDDRASFAGRERLVRETVELITSPGSQRALLFVTGASGSGKSSFAQAGLLPALEQFYTRRNLAARHAVMRAGLHPLAALADALLQLGLPPDGPFAAARPFMVGVSSPLSSGGIIGLLVIDQFEELFSPQVDPIERDALLAVLASLPPFSACPVHLVATLRADYLPDLFAHRILYDLAKQGVDLRVMEPEELQAAILSPLQVAYPNKRIEPSLLDRLAADAAVDATYLPLLQVALEDLFRSGSLTPENYHSLADALRARADAVQDFVDYDGERRQVRSREERETVIVLCLDLVRVSLDDDPRRDVRRRQPLAALVHGSQEEQVRRGRLVRELVDARLLSASAAIPQDGPIDATDVAIDIIHESLIARWDRLRTAVAERRDALQQGERFSQALAEWHEHAGDPGAEGYLLTGVRLAEAEALAARDDVVVRLEGGPEFISRSLRKRDETRRRQLRRTRLVASILGMLALTALIAAVIAIDRQRAAVAERDRANNQTRIVEGQRRVAQANQLAAEARFVADRQAQLGALIAAEAFDLSGPDEPLPAGVAQMVHTFGGAASDWFPARPETIWQIALSDDGRSLVTSDERGTFQIWDLSTPSLSPNAYPLGDEFDFVRVVQLSADGSLLATRTRAGSVQLWRLAPGQAPTQIVEVALPGAPLVAHALSRDGYTLAAGDAAGRLLRWSVAGPNTPATLDRQSGPTGSPIQHLLLSDDGRVMVSSDEAGRVLLWTNDTTQPAVLTTTASLVDLALSADGQRLVAWTEQQNVLVWSIAANGLAGESVTLPEAGGKPVDLALSADGTVMAAATRGQTITVWAFEQGRAVHRGTLVGEQDQRFVEVLLSRDGRTLFSATSGGAILMWDTEQLSPDKPGSNIEPQLMLRGHAEGAWELALARDGQRLVSAGFDGTIRVWELGSVFLQGPSRSEPFDGAVERQLLEQSGSPMLAEVSAGGTLRTRLLQPDGQTILATRWQLEVGPLRQGVLSSDGKAFAVVAVDGRVYAGTDAAPRLVSTVTPGSAVELALSGDARFVVILEDGYDAQVCTWDGDSYDTCPGTWSGSFEPDTQVAFSSPVGLMGLGSRESIGVARVQGDSINRLIQLPLDNVQALVDLAISADGRRVAALTNRGLFIWHLDEPNPVLSVRYVASLFAPTDRVVLSPAGVLVARMQPEGPASFWQLTPQGTRDRICRTVTRNLSADEWRQYVGDAPYQRTCPELPEGRGTDAREQAPALSRTAVP